ncbi:MAG TPA: hypothetical protein VFQ45_06545 [Longimicrobium sp.]|nr:hypothetical protein [Longimicrobium sp.]
MNNSWILHPLSEHPLSQACSEALYLAFDEIPEDEAGGLAAAALGVGPPGEHGYSARVHAWLTRMLESLHRAKLSTVFLRRFPSPRTYERNGISASNWLEYHYAFYTITISGLVDLALILTNEVWELGNEEKNCRWHIITKDGRLPASVIGVLKDIDSVVKRTRDLRDHRVHRGKAISFSDVFSDDVAGAFQLIDSMKTVFLQQDGGTPDWLDAAEPLLSELSAMISAGLIERVEGDLAELNSHAERLFDELTPGYLAATSRRADG